MSSTSNVQNLLTNVFRPSYNYDTTNSNYYTTLDLVNIDAISANTVNVYTVSAGDSNGNVYIGSNSGNLYSNARGCSNVTALGAFAGYNISNISNSVLIGYQSGYGGTAGGGNSVAIGTQTAAEGYSNVYIGYNTGNKSPLQGNNNIFIGANLSTATAVSNTLYLGGTITYPCINGITSTTSYSNYVGVNGPAISGIPLFVNGYTRIGAATAIPTINNGFLAINTAPGNYHLDVNGTFRSSDGQGTMTFSNNIFSNTGQTVSTGGFNSISGSVTLGVGGTVTVGTYKKGYILMSAMNSDASIYTSLLTLCITPSSGLCLPQINNLSGGISFQAVTSNITLSNVTTAATFRYCITYFPMP